MIHTSYILDLMKGLDKEGIKGLNFRQNQLLIGEVLDLLSDRQVIVSVKGTKVLAHTEVPLKKGQQSLFLVNSVKDNVTLKLIAKNLYHTNVTKDIMNDLGIKNTKDNQKMVEFFIKHQLPVEKDIITFLNQSVKEGKNLNQLLAIVKILANKQIPPSPLAIKLLHEFHFGKELVKQLEMMSQTYNKLPIAEKDSIPVELKANIRALVEQLQRVIKDAKFPQENENNRVIPNELNKHVNSSTEKVPTEQRIGLDRLMVDRQTMDAPRLMKAIISYLEEIHMQHTKNDTNQQMQTLKQQLELLFTQKEMLPEALAKQVEGAYHQLGGQHLAAINHSSDLSHVIIQLPGLFIEGEEPIYVQVNAKKKDKHSIDPKDIFFVFLFQLQHLGTVTVQMKVIEQQILFQISNENAHAKELFKQLEPDFIDFLKNEGFQTTGFSFTRVKKDEDTANPMLDASLNTMGVDIRI